MSNQTNKITLPILTIFNLPPEEYPTVWWEVGEEPDHNFYKDEEELTRELSSPIPAGAIIQSLVKTDPDELEATYQWFLA